MPSLYLVELFSGTGSFGRAAAKEAARHGYGLKHLSLDLLPQYGAHVQVDLLAWPYVRDLGRFLEDRTSEDVLWMHASPPCNQYSRERRMVARDMALADPLVQRVLRIRRFLRPDWFTIENPVGLLQTRPFMQAMERFKKEVSYCHFGRPFRKNTMFWTNVGVELPVCRGATKCAVKQATGRHHEEASGWAFVGSDGIKRRQPRNRLYSIPSRLVRLLVRTALQAPRR